MWWYRHPSFAVTTGGSWFSRFPLVTALFIDPTHFSAFVRPLTTANEPRAVTFIGATAPFAGQTALSNDRAPGTTTISDNLNGRLLHVTNLSALRAFLSRVTRVA